jgi:glucose 1-dehydrogenase
MLKKQFDLSGKLALITGSSQGIGKGIALALAEYGAEVIVVYHSGKEEGQKVVKEIQKMERKAHLFQADLTKKDSAKKLHTRLKEKKLLPDILVINASVQVPKDWLDVTDKDFDQQVNANFRSTLHLMQLFVPEMTKKKWGRVLTLGSVQQQKPHPAMIVYAATKAAVENMVKNLALQLADQGVTINNLAPGVIGTPRLDEPVPEVDESIGNRMTIPMENPGEPVDCAALALLLCSEAGRYITGQNYNVDGGMSL